MSDDPTRDFSIERFPSGVPGFDILSDGGLPRDRATLIAGRSGTCKSLFALQVACETARNGTRVLYVAVEDPPGDLQHSGDALGFRTSELIDEGFLEIADLAHPMQGPVFVSGAFDVGGLIARVQHMAERHGAELVIIDSISALFAPLPDSSMLRHHFFQLVRAFTPGHGTSLILTVESPNEYGPIGPLGFEDHVCDLIIVMRNLVDGKRRRRTVEIHKYRRSPHYKGEFPCALTDEGLSVFPLDAVNPGAETRSGRVKSGIDGLDELLQGGWLSDSIALVRGPTGSGKTILSSHYAVAGASRGERVFYYGFEESRESLMRNLDTLGIPVRKYVDEGSLKLTCRFPEATSPEDMIIELRSVIDKHKPGLIVIDSISAIEHVTSYESFRQFIIGVTSALRQHGRSAILTQAIAQDQTTDVSAPYLSTMADAILTLSYDLQSDGMDRRVRVLKLRGSGHTMGSVPMDITDSGMVIHAAGT